MIIVLELFLTASLFRIQCIVGRGYPFALHVTVTALKTLTVSFGGLMLVITAGTTEMIHDNDNLIQNSQAVKKQCGPQKGYGEKRCEIQGGGQEMAVMVD